MAQQYPEWIWQNGSIKPWAEATTHVMSHALHYGSSVFEGIRSYATPDGAAIFRLTDHLNRLYQSAKIYDMVLPHSADELAAACRAVIKKNELGAAYLRPVAYRGLGGFGLSAETPIDVAVAAWPMGPYLGPEALQNGIDACVSSWQRFAPNTIPAGAKAGGNYLSGQLIAREARRLGFGEGIALASSGLLSEGAGENLFPRHAEDTGSRRWHRRGRTRYPARVPVSRRRAVDVRHRRRDHPDPFGRRQAGRHRQGRPRDPAPAGTVLRPVRRPHPRQVGLAGTGLSVQQATLAHENAPRCGAFLFLPCFAPSSA
jgi:branched-subunit amino acid aminotransferase/4-amino-4-deoxychorismate lyase